MLKRQEQSASFRTPSGSDVDGARVGDQRRDGRPLCPRHHARAHDPDVHHHKGPRRVARLHSADLAGRAVDQFVGDPTAVTVFWA